MVSDITRIAEVSGLDIEEVSICMINLCEVFNYPDYDKKEYDNALLMGMYING